MSLPASCRRRYISSTSQTHNHQSFSFVCILQYAVCTCRIHAPPSTISLGWSRGLICIRFDSVFLTDRLVVQVRMLPTSHLRSTDILQIRRIGTCELDVPHVDHADHVTCITYMELGAETLRGISRPLLLFFSSLFAREELKHAVNQLT